MRLSERSAQIAVDTSGAATRAPFAHNDHRGFASQSGRRSWQFGHWQQLHEYATLTTRMTIRLSPHGTWFTELDTIVVNYRHDGPLSAPAFDEWIAALSQPGVTGFLSCAIGPVQMSSVQRHRAAEFAMDASLRTLVVTDDRIGRGIVTAVGWLGAPIRAASWTKIAESAAFLGVDSASALRLAELAWELRHRALQRAI